MRPILYEKTFYSDSGEKTLCICGFSDKSDKKDYAIYIDSDHVNETSICLSSEDLSELIVTLVSQRTLKIFVGRVNKDLNNENKNSTIKG